MAYSNNFSLVIEGIKKVEGGYVNNPADSGGATNFGIAFNYNKEPLAKIGITRPEQMKNLTWEQAKNIYYEKYWKPLWDSIPLAWADIIFNFSINAGANAIRALQLALVASGQGIEVDGVYGSLTQAALGKVDGIRGRGLFRYYMQNFYQTLAKNNPSQQIFLNGWLNRIKATGSVITPTEAESRLADAAIEKKKLTTFSPCQADNLPQEAEAETTIPDTTITSAITVRLKR